MTDRSVVYRLRAEIGQFSAQMAQASASTRKLAGDLTAVDAAAAKKRASLTKFGNVAGGVGLVAAAGLGVAVKTAADFEQSMSKVQAATHETTANMERLRAAALQAGADTAFSADEAAAGIENLAKAGVSTNDILDGGLMGALDLAAAGELDVADAAEIAATTMNQFGLAGKDVGHIADVLAAAAGKAQGEVTDMAGALKYVGPVAAQMGVSLDETAGSIAFLASQGVLGEQAGTSLRGMLTSLTSPSKIASETMADLGISMYDAQGQFIGLDGIAGQLHATMGDLSNAERDEALGRIFGNEQITTARILYQGGAKAVEDWTNKVNDSGFAAETAAIKQDNLRGDLEKLGGSLQTALIGTGDGTLGPLRQLTQGLEGVVNAYNNLPDPAKGGVAAALGLTAVAGGGLWVTTKIVNGIASASDAMETLGIETGKTKGALKNIGTATVGLAAIIATADLAQVAIEKLADTNIDTGTLNRDLEALADDRLTGNLDNLFHTFQDIQNETEHDWNPLTWVSGFDPSGFENATEGVKSIDEALAGLVESGNAETAAAAFENLGPTARKAGLSTAELTKIFPEYQTALKNTADESDKTAGSNDTLAGSTKGAAKAMRQLTGVSAEEAKALEEAHKAAEETGRAFFGLGDKVNKAKVSLGGWLRSLERQRQALHDFRINAETAARKGLDEGLIASLQEAGPEGALRMKQLANATESQIGHANQVWRSGQREIDKFADSVTDAQQVAGRGIHANVKVDGVEAAINALTDVGDWMNNLDGKTATTWVTTRHVNGGGMGPQSRAEGGTILGTRQPYGDKVLAFLAPGEEIISNRYGQADRHRDLLKAINAGRYADGGTIAARSASPSVSVGSPSVSVGGAQVRVFIDGREVRAIVRSEQDADRRYHANLEDRP